MLDQHRKRLGASNPAPDAVYSNAQKGAITAGTNVFSSSATSAQNAPHWTSADIGKKIQVVGSGPGGATLTTTISGVQNQSTVTLAAAASTTVGAAVYAYGTDNTAAFQAAIDAAQANGGIDLYVPPGQYFVPGQLWLPSIDNLVPPFSIRMVGGQKARCTGTMFPGSVLPPPNAAATIISLASSGSIFGCVAPQSAHPFSNIILQLERIAFRTYPNPRVCALDLNNISGVMLDDVSLDTGEFTMQDELEPTNPCYGIRLPDNNNGAVCEIGYLSIEGWNTGIRIVEHCNADFLGLYNCQTAAEFPGCYHSNQIRRMDIEWCKNGVRFSGTTPQTSQANVVIAVLDIEQDMVDWRVGGFDIIDSGHGYGSIGWLTTNNSGLVHNLRVAGPTHLKLYDIAATSNTTPPRLPQSRVTLSQSPTSILVGGTVTVTWSGIPSPTSTDWVGVYVPGDPETSFKDWAYVGSGTRTPGPAVGSGTCQFHISSGLARGIYELRLYSAGGFNRLASSGQFTIN